MCYHTVHYIGENRIIQLTTADCFSNYIKAGSSHLAQHNINLAKQWQIKLRFPPPPPPPPLPHPSNRVSTACLASSCRASSESLVWSFSTRCPLSVQVINYAAYKYDNNSLPQYAHIWKCEGTDNVLKTCGSSTILIYLNG